jgi:hypothetical protein
MGKPVTYAVAEEISAGVYVVGLLLFKKSRTFGKLVKERT